MPTASGTADSAVLDMAPADGPQTENPVATQIKGIEGLLAHHRSELVRGSARIDGPGRVSAVGKEGQMLKSWEYDRLIIATGSQPFSVPAFPFRRQTRSSPATTSSQSKTVPESILIVGGGVIGCEFACILSAMGAKVTVVEALDRMLPLPSVDAGCSKVLEREMKKRKIKFFVNRVVESIEADEAGLTADHRPFSLRFPFEGERTRFRSRCNGGPKALVCIGRSPNTQGIGLSTIGVETDAKGWIPVDDRMRTGVRRRVRHR
jgi:dihydrolipoamide dehydrogenase